MSNKKMKANNMERKLVNKVKKKKYFSEIEHTIGHNDTYEKKNNHVNKI